MVALLGPKPMPSKNLKPTIIRQLYEKACARQEPMENMQAKKIVPRRPSTLFRGWVSLGSSQIQTLRDGFHVPATEYATKIRSAGNETNEDLVPSDTKRINVECLRYRSKRSAILSWTFYM